MSNTSEPGTKILHQLQLRDFSNPDSTEHRHDYEDEDEAKAKKKEAEEAGLDVNLIQVRKYDHDVPLNKSIYASIQECFDDCPLNPVYAQVQVETLGEDDTTGEHPCQEEGCKNDSIIDFLGRKVCSDHLRQELAEAPKALDTAEVGVATTKSLDRLKYENVVQKVKTDMQKGKEKLDVMALDERLKQEKAAAHVPPTCESPEHDTSFDEDNPPEGIRFCEGCKKDICEDCNSDNPYCPAGRHTPDCYGCFLGGTSECVACAGHQFEPTDREIAKMGHGHHEDMQPGPADPDNPGDIPVSSHSHIPMSQDDIDFFRGVDTAQKIMRETRDSADRRVVNLNDPIDTKAHMLEAHEWDDDWFDDDETGEPRPHEDIRGEHDDQHETAENGGYAHEFPNAMTLDNSHFHTAQKRTAQLAEGERYFRNKGEKLWHEVDPQGRDRIINDPAIEPRFRGLGPDGLTKCEKPVYAEHGQFSSDHGGKLCAACWRTRSTLPKDSSTKKERDMFACERCDEQATHEVVTHRGERGLLCTSHVQTYTTALRIAGIQGRAFPLQKEAYQFTAADNPVRTVNYGPRYPNTPEDVIQVGNPEVPRPRSWSGPGKGPGDQCSNCHRKYDNSQLSYGVCNDCRKTHAKKQFGAWETRDYTPLGTRCECNHPAEDVPGGHLPNGDCTADNCPCQVLRKIAKSPEGDARTCPECDGSGENPEGNGDCPRCHGDCYITKGSHRTAEQIPLGTCDGPGCNNAIHSGDYMNVGDKKLCGMTCVDATLAQTDKPLRWDERKTAQVEDADPSDLCEYCQGRKCDFCHHTGLTMTPTEEEKRNDMFGMPLNDSPVVTVPWDDSLHSPRRTMSSTEEQEDTDLSVFQQDHHHTVKPNLKDQIAHAETHEQEDTNSENSHTSSQGFKGISILRSGAPKKKKKKKEEPPEDITGADVANGVKKILDKADQVVKKAHGTELPTAVGDGIHANPIEFIVDHRGLLNLHSEKADCRTCGRPMELHAQWDPPTTQHAAGMWDDASQSHPGVLNEQDNVCKGCGNWLPPVVKSMVDSIPFCTSCIGDGKYNEPGRGK